MHFASPISSDEKFMSRGELPNGITIFSACSDPIQMLIEMLACTAENVVDTRCRQLMLGGASSAS